MYVLINLLVIDVGWVLSTATHMGKVHFEWGNNKA
ncbi:hypothetical protein SAMN05216464_101323 [Mucilaginibacter pineti]|uniref:Uncharacterized protein n=1 Tax=Mucilaginibacter pineti TaxID=1391627 RepID=A0A1G6TK39_9SPHI|nr:hypothetical protein SAMN05216464_101323 [Mucilaginibacter pineti]